MEEVVVYIIVAASALALAIKIRKGMKQKGCSSGCCSGCNNGCNGYSDCSKYGKGYNNEQIS